MPEHWWSTMALRVTGSSAFADDDQEGRHTFVEGAAAKE
jgi:hypothetical protein